jgi:hypothetical protein
MPYTECDFCDYSCIICKEYVCFSHKNTVYSHDHKSCFHCGNNEIIICEDCYINDDLYAQYFCVFCTSANDNITCINCCSGNDTEKCKSKLNIYYNYDKLLLMNYETQLYLLCKYYYVPKVIKNIIKKYLL